jgi:hypothetical protein
MTTSDDTVAAEKIESVTAIVLQARKDVAAIIKQETESWSTSCALRCGESAPGETGRE